VLIMENMVKVNPMDKIYNLILLAICICTSDQILRVYCHDTSSLKDILSY
jgi:hypothetical protein